MSPLIIGHLGHPSIRVVSRHESLHVHVESFMDTISNSRCKYQSLTHRLVSNVGTPVSSDVVLEKHISKKDT